ncbi:MAG TPA: hypothetical protein VHD32_08895 [Candidatus Didemnitutus sp.]|nr:hypothetical protein [Candidatus Didemnitutus sp.]
MPMTRLGRILFAGGLAGMGVLSLIYHDFGMNWQPVPDWVPLRPILGSLSGAILLAGGLGVFVDRFSAWAAMLLAGFVTLWLLVLQVPRVAANPGDAGVWLGWGENAMLVAGGWTVWISRAGARDAHGAALARSPKKLRATRILYGVALPVIGLSHFVYADFTASMIPGWIPGRLPLAYLTGAGHMAAGVAVLLGIVPRLGATLEAIMVSLFVLLLHLPGVIHAPTDRLQWTMLCVACALCGAAWTMAGSLERTKS